MYRESIELASGQAGATFDSAPEHQRGLLRRKPTSSGISPTVDTLRRRSTTSARDTFAVSDECELNSSDSRPSESK
jgi:hypothetical protein